MALSRTTLVAAALLTLSACGPKPVDTPSSPFPTASGTVAAGSPSPTASGSPVGTPTEAAQAPSKLPKDMPEIAARLEGGEFVSIPDTNLGIGVPTGWTAKAGSKILEVSTTKVKDARVVMRPLGEVESAAAAADRGKRMLQTGPKEKGVTKIEVLSSGKGTRKVGGLNLELRTWTVQYWGKAGKPPKNEMVRGAYWTIDGTGWAFHGYGPAANFAPAEGKFDAMIDTIRVLDEKTTASTKPSGPANAGSPMPAASPPPPPPSPASPQAPKPGETPPAGPNPHATPAVGNPPPPKPGETPPAGPSPGAKPAAAPSNPKPPKPGETPPAGPNPDSRPEAPPSPPKPR